MPMIRRDNHFYVRVQAPLTLLYTTAQLKKIHRNFFHSSPEKRFSVIHRAKPDKKTLDKLKIQRDISSRCDSCQRIQVGLRRFRARFGAEKTIFSGRVLLDVVYIENVPMLHIVDKSARF